MMHFSRIFVFIVAAVAMAQAPTAAIHGSLTDSSGAVIPSAVVVLTGDGDRKSVQTSVDGSYVFSALPAGDYKISVAFPGFSPFERALKLLGGETAQLPVQLVPGTGKQEINVTADADTVNVEPEHNASAVVLKDKDLDALPDDPADLNDMLQALAGPSAGLNTPAMLVDGFTGGQLPPKNTIKEVRLSQNPFSSEYGDLGFGRVEIITKPGADSLHAQFQLTDSDSFFNSRNPYAANKADYVNRSFNETLGNSFRHKVSWLLNATQNKIDNDAIIHAVTLDPSTLVSVPVEQSVLTPRNYFAGTARFDYQLTASDTISARYTYGRSDRQNNGIGGYSLTDRAFASENSNQELQITGTAVLTPAVANETRFSFSHFSTNQFDENAKPGLNVTGAFSSGGAQVGNAFNNEKDFDLRNVTTAIRGAHTLRFGGYWHRIQIVDSSPSNFGGTFTFLGVNNVPALDSANQPIPGTSISISSLEQYRRTLLFQKLHYPAATIRALGGGASQFSISDGNPVAGVNQSFADLFIQDDWRIRPNLTSAPAFAGKLQTDYS